MPTQFIFDRLQKQQEETITEILSLLRKKPYPDKPTLQLAKFTEALFDAGKKIREDEKLKVETKKQIKEEKPENLEERRKRKIKIDEEIELIKSLLPKEIIPMMRPMPQLQPIKATPPLPEVKLPISYSLDIFENSINITIAEDAKTKQAKYYLEGPQISLKLIASIKNELKKDFEKDQKVISDTEKVAKITKKICEKEKVQFTDDMVKKVKFFLERDWIGFMKLDPLLRDPNVKSVYCEGIDKPILIEHSSVPDKIETNIMFTENTDIDGIIERIAKKSGNDVTKEKPVLNTMFMGVQIEAILGVGGISSKLTLKKVV